MSVKGIKREISMKRVVQIAIIAFLVLVILSGAFAFLFYLEIMPVPAFLNKMPLVGSHLPQEKAEVEELSELDKLKSENASLQTELSAKVAEIEKLNADIELVQKKLEQSQAKSDEIQAQVDKLKQELSDSSQQQKKNEQAYKDLAGYYAEMKVKNAADIMQSLSDADIIAVFSHMESDKVAEILQNMDKNRAATISKNMLPASS